MSAAATSSVAVAPTWDCCPLFGAWLFWSMASTRTLRSRVSATIAGVAAVRRGVDGMALHHVDAVARQDEAAGGGVDVHRHRDGAHARLQDHGHVAALAAADELGVGDRLVGQDRLAHDRAVELLHRLVAAGDDGGGGRDGLIRLRRPAAAVVSAGRRAGALAVGDEGGLTAFAGQSCQARSFGPRRVPDRQVVLGDQTRAIGWAGAATAAACGGGVLCRVSAPTTSISAMAPTAAIARTMNILVRPIGGGLRRRSVDLAQPMVNDALSGEVNG